LVLFQQENQYKELTQLDSQLQEYFSIVRENNGKRAWWKQVGLYDKQAELAADMAKAAAGNLVWKREEGQFSQKTNQNSYVLQADRADSLLAYGNVKGTEQEKLNAILRLLQNIRYEEDLNDQFRFPLETLNLGSGDCDDFSILSATLLERANIPTAIVLVSNEDGTLAHAWIAVQGEFDLPVADINLPGKWHLVEPQFTIAQQAQEWFDQYPRTLAVAEV
ncbi:MAG: transglutaminase-like domain-containing protein, partial [Candidatus Woesearchaeota archaeon]|nr:transglutaminase-like domain-containing protein [Candidatus Woesearchaeota archaeon]